MVTRSSRILGTVAYLTDVLGKIAGGWPKDRIAELLPHRWVQPQPPAQPDTPH